MLNKFGQLIDYLYKNVIIIFFWPIMLSLTALAAISTATTDMDVSEITYYLSDNLFINILAVCVFIIIAYIISQNSYYKRFAKRMETDTAIFKKYRNLCLLIIFLISAIWVLSTQYIPQYDQEYIQNAVYSLHIEDYDLFAPANYMARYTQQLGLVWFYYLISLIIGINNYVGLQLVNALALTVFYYSICKICDLLEYSHMAQLAVLIMGIIFFPPIMYCSYIYGNILGLTFSSIAIYYELKFFKFYKIKHAVISAISIAIGACLKSNYLIFMIGMVLFAVVRIFTEQKLRYSLLLILISITYLLQSKAPLALSQHVTGHPLDQSTSSWSWIAMGLQDNEKSPGWYNGYNWDSYREAGFNTESQAINSKENIESSIKYFKENSEEAVRFFTKKAVSQWNNPTYQCVWTTQVMNSSIYPAGWAYYIKTPTGTIQALNFLNIVQFIIFVGTILYCFLCWKEKSYSDSLIFAMIFIGGFIFHQIWEAKSQYVFSYVVLLLPYCVAGSGKLLSNISNLKESTKSFSLSWFIKAPFAVLTVITIVFNLNIHSTSGLEYIMKDDKIFNSYVDSKLYIATSENGIYSFSTASGYMLSHSIKDGYFVPVVHLTDTADETSYLLLKNHQQDTWLRFTASNTMLSYTEDGTESRQTVMAIENELRDSQKWTVEAAGDGMVHIRYQKNYLTYDEETMEVYTAPYSGMENQIWNVNKL